MSYLTDKLNNMLADFDNIKRTVKDKDPLLFEQWKAGGFIVDNNVVSMYPNIEEVVEQLAAEEESEEEEETEEEEG